MHERDSKSIAAHTPHAVSAFAGVQQSLVYLSKICNLATTLTPKESRSLTAESRPALLVRAYQVEPQLMLEKAVILLLEPILV